MSERGSLAKFEALAQRLFEGSLERVIGVELEPTTISARLLKVAQESESASQSVDLFEVSLHPAELTALLKDQPDLSQVLARGLEEQWSTAARARRLVVLLVPDAALSRRQMAVRALRQSDDDRVDTTIVRRTDDERIRRLLQALDAFLIIDGQRHVPLDRPFLTVGRDVENDIVLDHSSVSRRHAQIRLRHGHFMFYDVGSRGGSAINGQAVQEWLLQPGDLIYLARQSPLIYGEGLESREKLPRQPSPDDQETGVIGGNLSS